MQAKARLGRGLDALLGGESDGVPAESPRVPVNRIKQNPFQPRKTFDDDELAKLSDSIKTHGLLQPVLVRPCDDGFQLIAGERRLRAAQAAGLSDIPVTVVDFNDQQAFEAALVENVQRADLNPIEKAQGFKDYIDRFGLTHEQLAAKIGVDRTTISNLLGLLNLPAEVQDYVRVGQLTLGHAKVLKGLSNPERQVALAKEVIAKSLSVHALEALSKEVKAAATTAAVGDKPAVIEKTSHVLGIENELRQKLATRFEIKLKARDKGQIIVGFDSTDDFERIVEVLRR